MARVLNSDRSLRSGKLSKKSDEIHRVRNFKEYVYKIENPNTKPPTEAQTLHRAKYARVNSKVNVIMGNPTQVAAFDKLRKEHNRGKKYPLANPDKKYDTTRQFVFDIYMRMESESPEEQAKQAALPFTLPKDVTLQILPFAQLTTVDLYEILKARFSVFVGEQHIHYLDEDDIDPVATHLSLRRHGQVIAYARLFHADEPATMLVGRMLTIERGKGFGRYLMQQIIGEARRQGAATLRLHAQTHAVPFYELCGFHTVGDIFIEAEIEHVMMELTVES